MREIADRHDRIVATILALLMVLSVGGAPVAASLDASETSSQAASTLSTQISSCTTISSPGHYDLTNDITGSTASTCIRIAASDVVLDGNGHVVEGVGNSGTRGVYVFKSPSAGQGITLDNVTVTNLGVTDWEKGIEFSRVASGVVEGVEAWQNDQGVRFAVLSRGHGVYGSGFAENADGLVLDGNGEAEVRENVFEANDWAIDVSTDANRIEGNELYANDYGVRTYSTDGTEILGNHFEDHQSFSVLLDSYTTNTVVAENGIYGNNGALAGIWVEASNNQVIGNTLVESGRDGIVVATASDNLIADNRVERVENGLVAYSATENQFEVNTVRETEFAIRLEDGAQSNVFQNDDVAGNGWAYYAEWDASSMAENIFVGDSTSPTSLTFRGRDVGVRTVSAPPATPPTLGSLDKFVYTEPTSSDAELDLSFHYTDSEVNQSGLNESQLRLWRHNASLGQNGTWEQVSPPNDVSESRNVVRANVDSFGVIAPLSIPVNNVSRIGFKYGDYGGNLNVEINGDFRNIGQFHELDGTTVGGTSVSVTNTTVTGGEQGVVEIVGAVNSFSVGGQEMWMDDVEFGPTWGPRATVDFEILTPPKSSYQVNETFRSSPDNVSIAVEGFTWWDGTVYYGGEALPANNSPPMSGGSGQDLYPNNANVRFGVGEIINGTSAP